MHMCRFCKQDHNRMRMFKYAARHWAHYDCWLKAKGIEIAHPETYHEILGLLENALHGWQLRNFPVFALADWLEAHKTETPGKSWMDKACNLLKRAIEHAEREPVKTPMESKGGYCPKCRLYRTSVNVEGICSYCEPKKPQVCEGCNKGEPLDGGLCVECKKALCKAALALGTRANK